jgi:arylsulfatase A-like enzyme
LFIAPKSVHAEGPRAVPSPQYKDVLKHVRLPESPAFNEADLKRKALKAPRVDNETRDGLERTYRAALRSLQSVDDLVAAVMAKLKDNDKLDNTVVIYTSDNGFLFGDHWLVGKTAAYEGSIRVPLLMRGPGIPENQTRDQLVSNLDVTATIVDLAGAKPGVPLDGKSLVPVFAGDAVPWRSALLIESPVTSFEKKTNRYVGVRTATKKYVRYEGGFEELFDLAADPYELKNVVSDEAEASNLSALRGIHDTLKSCAGASCWVP